MRHRRYIAYILVTVLCLGVIAPGLLGVFPNIAKADALYHADTIYWGDFRSHVESLMNSVNTPYSDRVTIISILDRCEQNLSNPRYNIIIAWNRQTGECACSPYYQNNDAGTQGWFIDATILAQNVVRYNLNNVQQTWYRDDIKTWGWFCFNGETFNHVVSVDTNHDEGIYISGDWHFHAENFFPSPYVWNNGLDCYCSQNIVNGTSYNNIPTYSYNANISATPLIEDFEVLTFNLGSQVYITCNKQLLMARMDTETMDYDFCVGFYNSSSYIQEFIYFQDYDRVQINYPGNVVNNIVDTIPVGGIYAINITGIISEGYDEIYAALFGSLEDDTTAARAVNVPISLSSEEEIEENQYVNYWSTFNEFNNSYNTTHVIPMSLGDTLFGLSGSQIYPCTVMVPRSVWQNSPDHDNGTSFADAPTWLWWFPLIPDNLGFNYNLLDTIILSESATGEYSVVYWYDDNLTKKFLKVKDQYFEDILQEFDCIIIIPDDDGCLRASNWWRNTLDGICQNLGFDTPSLLNSLSICGSSSLGVEYVEDQPEEFTHELQGYALLTPKAIQKQMLWNFNDGITKLYQLEVDYIDSEDKWKDSFLLWSSSVFYAIDSLGGKLDSLITKLGHIEGKLDTLIQNTSEEESSYWFISLWNWVVQFNPSDNDFSNSLQQYDNNWNNMPSLPPPSPLPMLPGGE